MIMCYRLQLIKVTNYKNADVAKGGVILLPFQLLETLVDLWQHVGSNHGHLINDEQLQVGELQPQGVQLRAALETLDVLRSSPECSVIPTMLNAAEPVGAAITSSG